jgi:hypothetical protein
MVKSEGPSWIFPRSRVRDACNRFATTRAARLVGWAKALALRY